MPCMLVMRIDRKLFITCVNGVRAGKLHMILCDFLTKTSRIKLRYG